MLIFGHFIGVPKSCDASLAVVFQHLIHGEPDSTLETFAGHKFDRIFVFAAVTMLKSAFVAKLATPRLPGMIPAFFLPRILAIFR